MTLFEVFELVPMGDFLLENALFFFGEFTKKLFARRFGTFVVLEIVVVDHEVEFVDRTE